jgi:hypothetical protein
MEAGAVRVFVHIGRGRACRNSARAHMCRPMICISLGCGNGGGELSNYELLAGAAPFANREEPTGDRILPDAPVASAVVSAQHEALLHTFHRLVTDVFYSFEYGNRPGVTIAYTVHVGARPKYTEVIL